MGFNLTSDEIQELSSLESQKEEVNVESLRLMKAMRIMTDERMKEIYAIDLDKHIKKEDELTKQIGLFVNGLIKKYNIE